jgi:hypothetical protein
MSCCCLVGDDWEAANSRPTPSERSCANGGGDVGAEIDRCEREKTVRFVRESMSNRVNDERSAIVVIMQRLHDADVSGDILRREANYCHMMIPMYFDPLRYPTASSNRVLMAVHWNGASICSDFSVRPCVSMRASTM